MRFAVLRTLLVLSTVGLVACAETGPGPVTPPTQPGGPRLGSVVEPVWTVSELESAFDDRFSWDTTQLGLSAPVYYDMTVGEEAEFCRDHFESVYLWWDGGWGTATIQLDPPLLFRSYRTGNFRDGRRLLWRKAVYETIETAEGVDPAGNVWRFKGRFNALCRGGSRQIGPFVFNAHMLVSQDPIDRPVLVRRADSGCDGGGNTALIENVEYNPYDPMISGWGADAGGCTREGSGMQYQPGDYTGGETVDWGTGAGNGGTSVCGKQAVVEYVCIDVYNVETGFWEEWGCGYVTTC